ncbi:MAG: ABC transporter ATP-binding protein [Candidatus Geothermincolia bacterium]
MSELVVVEGAVKTFRRGSEEVHAIDGVNLSVEKGELLTVVGPSGSGKTTLLNLIGCVDRPTSGRVVVHGMEVEDLTDRALATLRSTTIGFVFQQFFLIPTLTALENVMVPGRFSAKKSDGLEDRARALLTRVGLGKRADHLPGELSGGEMQRVAIARALINKPELLLADEPTGNLDMKSAADIAEILEKLNADGQTVVVVTHNPDLVSGAHRIIRLQDGKISEERRLREIEEAPAPPEGEADVLAAPVYMPSTVIRRKWGSPRVAALLALLGAGLFVAAFMPFIEKRTGSGLLREGLFTISVYRGNDLSRVYYGKPATIFTGIWPVLLGIALVAAAVLLFVKRPKTAGWISLAAGAIAAIVAFANLAMVFGRLGTDAAIGFKGMSPGYGLWVLLGFGLVSVGVGIWVLLGCRRQAGADEECPS